MCERNPLQCDRNATICTTASSNVATLGLQGNGDNMF